MPTRPFDADLDPQAQRALGERLRPLLEEDALDVREMAAGLGVEPEQVVVALRTLRAELRASGAGRLRTAVSRGRVTWRWEPAVASTAEPGAPASAPGGGRKKGKRKRGRARADAEAQPRRSERRT